VVKGSSNVVDRLSSESHQNSSHRPAQFGLEREPCLEASELYCTRRRHANTRVAKGRIAMDGAARYAGNAASRSYQASLPRNLA